MMRCNDTMIPDPTNVKAEATASEEDPATNDVTTNDVTTNDVTTNDVTPTANVSCNNLATTTALRKL